MNSQTQTTTSTTTFTVAHARHLAAKVSTDLKRIQRYYGLPSDTSIANYVGEITELLRFGYLGEVTYGYIKDGKHIIPTMRYTAKTLEIDSGTDDDPGRVPLNGDVTGASFTSHLTYSDAWWALTDAQRTQFKAALPIQRSTGDAPGVNGVYVEDRTYSAGGRSLGRATVRSES